VFSWQGFRKPIQKSPQPLFVKGGKGRHSRRRQRVFPVRVIIDHRAGTFQIANSLKYHLE
jgi:hypothetical protein